MVPAVIEKKKFTYEDYLKTPDDERYELIEGELLMTPSPITRHQRISRELEFEILKFVRNPSFVFAVMNSMISGWSALSIPMLAPRRLL